MANENPVAKKTIKGQYIDGSLPLSYRNTVSSSMGVEIIDEFRTGRRFLQGIPITRQSVSHIESDSNFDVVQRSDLERQLHQEDIDQNRRTATNNGEAWEIPFLIDRLDPLYQFSRVGDWHPTIIADRADYFPEGFINTVEQIADRVERVDRICRYVRENPIRRSSLVEGDEGAPVAVRVLFGILTGGLSELIIGPEEDQQFINQQFDEFYGQLALLCAGEIVDRPCNVVKEIIETYLDRGFRLELVAEGPSDDPLLANQSSGSITNFSLQTPLAVDDCAVKDLVSNITTGIETATVESVYQLYVDPNGDTPRFPPNTNLTLWPGRDYPGYNEYWDNALAHERTTQNKFNTTYYGNLNSKNKGGFPRYAGLSIPTYQASSFVDLFDRLDAEVGIYPHIVEMLENPDNEQRYKVKWEYYQTYQDNAGWRPFTRILSLRQTSLHTHLRHLQEEHQDQPDIFDVVQDAGSQAEEIGFSDEILPDYITDNLDLAPDFNCPPFITRIRSLLADESSQNLVEDVIEAQFNSPLGLFTGLITQELEYTEPLFYKITRERLVGLNIEEGNIGHLMVRDGAPVLGGQPIFHTNKINENYFTFEDRFVDYNDVYQYKVNAYTVVMTADYEATPMTKSQVQCIPSVNIEGIEGRLGENVTYSLLAFKPKFDIVDIPYVHPVYQEDIDGMVDSRRLTVALPPVRIIDNPPVAPGVDIIPYRGVANKMLFMFDIQTDKFIDDYIHLSLEEKLEFEEIYRRQKRDLICDLCENTVEFASEGEDIQTIQVFRTTVVPEIISEQNPSQMYRDAFGGAPYKEILMSEGSAFVDDIIPNVKYFYMFRATDKNGHVSNPSHIYRVEMVQEDGVIFPIIELYTPGMKKRGVKYKKMAKDLEIKPSLLMAEPNWSADEDNNLSWKIGARDDSVFGAKGKQFKIRLTSIDTGRKIEMIVTFNKDTKRVEVTEDRDIGE